MKVRTTQRVITMITFPVALMAAMPAVAQQKGKPDPAADYPGRPIRLIDPYAPGGGSGVVARLLSARLGDVWGKQIVVDKLAYASSGTGGSGHLAAELFVSIAKVQMTHVPYKGNGPAVLAVLGGETQLGFNNILAVLPHVKNNRLRAIGVTSPKRSPAVPDVPTLAESGVTDYEATSWNGVFAPAKTPRPIIDKLHRAIVDALHSPDIKEKLVGMGSDPVGSTPEEFLEHVKKELARWGRVIRENGIKPEGT